MTTTTELVKLTAQADRAEAAATKARERATQLRAQQEAAEQGRLDARRAEVETWDTHRADTFETTFAAEVDRTREQFHQAVAAGEGIHAAWVAYVTAQRLAYLEADRIGRQHAARTRRTYKHWEAQCKDWNRELSHLRQADAAGQDVLARLADLNTQINTATQDTPAPATRPAADLSPVDVLLLRVPRVMPSDDERRTRDLEARFGDTSFAAAYDRAVAAAVAPAEAAHHTEVAAARTLDA